MPAIYRSCDILLKLSSVEGFFGPPLEMMACGGTAVVSRVTGFDEYIRDGENALVVEIDDKAGAIAALKKLVQDHDLRKRLSKNGIKTAESMSWSSRTPLFAQAITELIKTSEALSAQKKFELRLKRVQKDAITSGMRHDRQLRSLARLKAFKPVEKIWNLISSANS